MSFQQPPITKNRRIRETDVIKTTARSYQSQFDEFREKGLDCDNGERIKNTSVNSVIRPIGNWRNLQNDRTGRGQKEEPAGGARGHYPHVKELKGHERREKSAVHLNSNQATHPPPFGP